RRLGFSLDSTSQELILRSQRRLDLRRRGTLMGAAEPPSHRPSPYPPADARFRALARLADLVLPVALLLAGPRFNAPVAFTLFGAALLLCADSLFGAGRSFGKR